ncbi:MAG TPA: hypothetical protein PLQ97_03305 [Myxococcota bacterium]|nr:hypothetical protein [Myxococcota bacterium]HQK51798.1 hypothetical protein [Myxococcota bacterium]
MADPRAFKRLNFFRGFLTTEDDWNEGERYHIEKRSLHARALHAPGVVPQFLEGLRVRQRGRGELNIEVSPGYAIDGQGRDLYLPETVIRAVNPGDFRLPQTVYVVLSYTEEPTDFVAYKENLQFKGHKRITEGVKVEVTAREPDIQAEVELARIQLEKGVKAIKDAVDPNHPRPNEIDLRYVPWAGVAGSFLKSKDREDLAQLLAHKIEIYSHLAHVLKISPALDVLHGAITLDMLLSAGLVDYRNVFSLLETLIQLQQALIREMEKGHPEICQSREFGVYKWNVSSVKLDRRHSLELLVDILTTQRNAHEAMKALFAQDLVPRTPRVAAEAPSEKIWEDIKVRSEDFTEILSIEARDFRRVDLLDIYDEASEKAHHFLIMDEKDRYRSRQKLKYPDGKVVEDVGVHFEGGKCSFEIRGIEPNRDVILIMRMDYVRGDSESEVYVNGRKAPNLVVAGNDIKFRWRNWPYRIPAELATEPTLRIQIAPIKAERDFNLFKVWAYQAR